jgi:hypothetical protein
LAIAAHIGARDGFDEFTINGTPFSMRAMQPRFRLDHGKRYRLHLCNATDRHASNPSAPSRDHAAHP